jgi:predicted signal transduction protein with EAL and GGDEF domain
MTILQSTLLASTSEIFFNGIAITMILISLGMIIIAIQHKRKFNRLIKETNESRQRLQTVINQIIMNPEQYSEDQKIKFISVLMSGLSASKQEIHLKKIVETTN